MRNPLTLPNLERERELYKLLDYVAEAVEDIQKIFPTPNLVGIFFNILEFCVRGWYSNVTVMSQTWWI